MKFNLVQCLPPGFTCVLTLCLMAGQSLHAQEVFRETTYAYGASPEVHWGELDPDTQRDFSKHNTWAATAVRHKPKPVELDLEGATHAELSVEFWGGHIGTAGQRFSVNGHDWIDLPQPVGTPTEPQRFHRMLHGNNAVPVPLEQLRDGTNVIRFAAGSQIAYSFDFGFYWIYDFTVRVYYDPAVKPHPSGAVTYPVEGKTFGEKLTVNIDASSPNGTIARVEVIGEYEDFDWDGDGIWREWQYSTHHGVLANHLGTLLQEPWQVGYNATWLPDQSEPIRVRARITDETGLTYLTPPVGGIVQQRKERGVRMIRCDVVPERWAARASRPERKGSMTLTEADLEGATMARMIVSTWSGDHDDTSRHELRLNGEVLAGRFGEFHNYDVDEIWVPLDRLKVGANEIGIYSEYMGHSLEINWPGPVLLIEYRKEAQ